MSCLAAAPAAAEDNSLVKLKSILEKKLDVVNKYINQSNQPRNYGKYYLGGQIKLLPTEEITANHIARVEDMNEQRKEHWFKSGQVWGPSEVLGDAEIQIIKDLITNRVSGGGRKRRRKSHKKRRKSRKKRKSRKRRK